MTHPSPTAEDFAAATERAQSFLSDSQFIVADHNIAQCFLEQSKRIAALEAELAHVRNDLADSEGHAKDLADAQLATRLPDRGPTHFLGYDEIGNCWFVAAIERRAELKAWTENYGDDREDPEGIIRVLPAGLSFSNVHFGTEKPSPIFPALLSGAATPAPTAALTEEEHSQVEDARRTRQRELKYHAEKYPSEWWSEAILELTDIIDRIAIKPAKSPPQGAEE